MTDNTSSSAHFEDEIDKIESLIAGAGRLLTERKQVDLALLEERVQKLCSAITEVPADISRPLAGRLKELLDMLDALETALTDEFGTMIKLAEKDTLDQAIKSYPSGSARENNRKKDD